MKTYTYSVGSSAFTGNTPWGEEWKQAKALATECHLPIFREIANGPQSIRQEVFLKCRAFQSIDRTDPSEYLIL